MKKHLIIFTMILLALTSGCSARVTTFPANSPSSFATPAPAVTLPPATPITQDLLIGRWKFCTAIDSVMGNDAARILYGTGYTYGGYLRFFKNGTFTKHVGVISDEYEHFSGTYDIANDIVTLYFYNGKQQTIIYDGEQIVLQRMEYDNNETISLYYEYFKKVSTKPYSEQDDKE